MVAHFDYYVNRGNTASSRGVLLIPRTTCGFSKMKDTNDTSGGYASTIAHTTTCPAIASALSTVLGSYLLSNKLLLSNGTNANIPSMAGANWQGAATSWDWYSSQCDLPNEIQIYGSTAFSSSFYDIGEANEKLAVFNFINHIEYNRSNFWLRSVSNSTLFAYATHSGNVNNGYASDSYTLRPLIYVG